MIAAALRQNVAPLCFSNSSFHGKFHWAFRNHVVLPLPPLLHFETNPHFTSCSGSGSGERQSTFYELLAHRHHFSPQSASQLASIMMRLKSPHRADSVLSFLKECGFSNSQLEKVVIARPQLLSSNLERYIKPKIQIFRDFGLSLTDVVQTFTNDPSIFKWSVNNRLAPSLSLLRNFLGTDKLPGLFKVSGCLFMNNLEKTLFPNIELLKKCGVSADRIIKIMHCYPTFLLCPVHRMKKFVDRADEMGVRRSSRVFLDAVRMLCMFSDENWKLKISTLRQLGFVDDDIASAFRKFPNLFGLSVENLKLKDRTLREIGFSDGDIAGIFRKTPMVYSLSRVRIKEAVEVLLANGRYDISCIASNPISLGRSIEKRYKPRLRVLELLEDKKLIKRWPGLSKLGQLTDKKFDEEYVAPFLEEIGDAYLSKSTGNVRR